MGAKDSMNNLSDAEIMHNLEWVDGEDLKDWLQYLIDEGITDMWSRVQILIGQLMFKECKCGYRTPRSMFEEKIIVNMDRHLTECQYRAPKVNYNWPQKRSDPYPQGAQGV